MTGSASPGLENVADIDLQTLAGGALAVPPTFNGKTRARTPGSVAVWILIYAELTEFALFFVVFLIARLVYPEVFREGPQHLNTLAGTANTIILVTSSFFVAKATHAMKAGKSRASLKWFWLTILAGMAYCAVKAWEYHWNVGAGVHSSNNLFFSFYYYLTFNHLLHVLIGMCTILWVTLRIHFDLYEVGEQEGPESAALYWHMIDLAWIIIFPLLYVLR